MCVRAGAGAPVHARMSCVHAHVHVCLCMHVYEHVGADALSMALTW
jgi:hypothetical protein